MRVLSIGHLRSTRPSVLSVRQPCCRLCYSSHNFRTTSPSTGSLCNMQPGDNDVLMGRGGRNHEHAGNEQLRNICRAKVPEYRRARKKQKNIMSKEILSQIKGMGGRFLRKCCKTNTWKLVKDATAREKVCQSLRDAVQEAHDLIGSSSEEASSSDEDEKVGGDTDDSEYCPSPPPPSLPPLRVASIYETTMIPTRGARRPIRVSPSEGSRNSRTTASSSHDDTPSGFQAFNDVELFGHFDSWFDGHHSTEPYEDSSHL